MDIEVVGEIVAHIDLHTVAAVVNIVHGIVGVPPEDKFPGIVVELVSDSGLVGDVVGDVLCIVEDILPGILVVLILDFDLDIGVVVILCIAPLMVVVVVVIECSVL